MRARRIVAWVGLVAALAVFPPTAPASAAEDVGDITTFTRANLERPSGITLGPDRNLWFTSRDTDRLGRITVNGTISLFDGPATGVPLPASTSDPQPPPSAASLLQPVTTSTSAPSAAIHR